MFTDVVKSQLYTKCALQNECFLQNELYALGIELIFDLIRSLQNE